MRAWKLVMASAVCLALSACRGDPNIPVLERELRLQEKEINRLRWSLEDCEGEVRSLQRENDALRQTPGGTTVVVPGVAPSRSRPKDELKIPADAVMTPPMVDVPKKFMPEGEIPDTLKPRNKRQPAGEGSVDPPKGLPPIDSGKRPAPATIDGPALNGAPPNGSARRLPVVKGDSRQVAKISLNPQMTGGFRSNGQQADDGLSVVLEPRDAHGRLVEAAGDVSIVVIDPSVPGSGGRIGRWDFTAADAAQLFRNDTGAQGIKIDVPWVGDPPKTDNLHLYVRYKTADGRKLQSDRPIQVDLAGREPRRLPVQDLPTAEGPSLLADRKRENWKVASTPVAPSDPTPVEAPSAEAAPAKEEVPLMASRPAEPKAASSAPVSSPVTAKPKSPPLPRPVWSPERP